MARTKNTHPTGIFVFHGCHVNAMALKHTIHRSPGGQKGLAAALGISQATVSNYISGKSAMPYSVGKYIEANIISAPTAQRLACVVAQPQPVVVPVPAPIDEPVVQIVVERETADITPGQPGNRPFPRIDALRVIRLAQDAHRTHNIAYTLAGRHLVMWETAYKLLTAEGFSYDDALIGAYDLTVRAKTEPGQADRKFSEESFHLIFGLEATACKVPPLEADATDKVWHSGAALAVPFVKAGKALWIWGDKGTGKTTALEMIVAHLQRLFPKAYTVQGTVDMNSDNFIGCMMARVVNGASETYACKGPLWLAMEEGVPLIIEEPSVLDPGILMNLQQVLTGKPLTITGLGEVQTVYALKGFGVYCADNTLGLGERPEYVGTRRMNDSFLDRFYFIEFGHFSDADMLKMAEIESRKLYAEQGWAQPV